MNKIRTLSFGCLFLLSACGGGGESSPDVTPSPELNPPNTGAAAANSTGQINLPAGESRFSGNLFLDIEAEDPDGITRVALKFADDAPLKIFCNSITSCGGTRFFETVSDVNPGNYGATAGLIDVQLLVTNSRQQVSVVSNRTLEWLPPTIENVAITRSSDNTSISVNWSLNPNLLRYNLYIASESGVNKENYQQLQNGQALLAVEQGPQTFSNLAIELDYFVLLAGIDGSGESTNLSEVALPSDLTINNPPEATNDIAELDEDTSIIIDVLLNDTDEDGDLLSLASVSADVGTASIENNQIRYQPPADYFGTALAQYAISDGNGGDATATISIDVLPVNDNPIANDDIAQTTSGVSVEINVIENDTDIENDPLTVIQVDANNGVASIIDNKVVFTPDINFVGSESLTYTINDGNGGEATALVNVTVNANSGNTPPVASDDTANVDEDTTLLVDILANDTDADNDPLTLTTVQTSTGSASIQNNQLFYAPPINFNGDVLVDYSISDGNGGNDSGQVSIIVNPVNDEPVAINDNAQTPVNTAVDINVLENDFDVDEDTLTLSTVSSDSGVATISGDLIQFEPETDVEGTATISYEITDGNGGAANAIVTVVVFSGNAPPLPVNDLVTMDEDTSVVIDVLANDTDADGDSLILEAVSASTGNVSIQNNFVVYTSPTDFFGAVTIEYLVVDDNGGSATGEALITVNPINDAPIAENDFIEMDEDTTQILDLLANDTDVDGDLLTIISVTPEMGVIRFLQGNYIYESPLNFYGSTRLDYEISDGNGEIASAEVFVTVNSVNDNPVANADTAVTDENIPTDIDALANDTDVDGDALSLVSASASSGTASVQNNLIRYVPETDFFGTTTIDYTVTDNNGGLANGQVSVTVNFVNSPPIANDDTATGNEDSLIIVNALTNDTDDDGHTLSINAVSASDGTVSVNNNQIEFLPTLNFNGSTLIDYTIDDGFGGTSSAQVFVTVNPVNDDPIAADDTDSTDEDTSLLISPLSNDSDVDGDDLTIISALAADGTVTIIGNQIDYSPTLNFNGDTTISYSIEDGNGGSASATIEVFVNPINDNPVAEDDYLETLPDETVNVDVLSNDTDIDGDTLTVVSASSQEGGFVVIETDYTLTYTPNDGFLGTDFIDYEIEDGNGGSATAVLIIDVGGLSRSPIANDDNYQAFGEQILTVSAAQGVLVNDIDPDGETITVDVTPLVSPTDGVLDLSADGSFTYLPLDGFVGTDSFVYQITDAYGLTRSASVNITVISIPSPLEGNSTSISGDLLYIGQGEIATNQGSGLYRVGDCYQNTDTTCSAVGFYNESSTSGNAPLTGGRYAFVQRYSGTGDSPVLAQSNAPLSDGLVFNSIGDATFDLHLFPSSGGIISMRYPETPFSDSLIFGAFIGTSQFCTGLPIGISCRIAEVGLRLGATLTAQLTSLNFTQPGEKWAEPSNASPQAAVDSYSTNFNTPLTVNAPGVLANDSDPDTPTIGASLTTMSTFDPGVASVLAIGVDEYSQRLYVANFFGSNIVLNDRRFGQTSLLSTFGEPTSKVDIEVTPSAVQFGGVQLDQGNLLFFNGETGPAEIYGYDPFADELITQVNTSVGNGDLVGGAYNPVTDSIFILLADQVATSRPTIFEINSNTGATIRQLNPDFDSIDFNVVYGDLDVNNQTGNLYLVSSESQNIIEISTNGDIIRQLVMPAGITMASGLATSEQGDRFWVSTAPGTIYELSFSNNGVAPQLMARVEVEPEYGTLQLNPDGSFTYTPYTNFNGEDGFIYEIQDGKGKNSLSRVSIFVND